MAFDVPTIVAADNAGNDTDYDAWVKARDLIRAANAGQLQGFKNKLINGSFDVWQRQTSFANPANTEAFTADRWRAARDTTLANTFTRQAGFLGARYCMRVERNSGETTTGNLRLVQTFETSESIPLAGKTILVSADVRVGANYSGGGALGMAWVSGTGTDQGSSGLAWTGVQSGFSFVGVTTTAARVQWTAFTFPSNATQCGVHFFHPTTGTAGAADYFEITNIQLEVVDATSPKSTPFDRRPIGLELALCRRYYQRFTGIMQIGAGCAYGTNFPLAVVRYETKRATPTVTVSAASAINILSNGASVATTAITPADLSVDGCRLDMTTASGVTAGHGVIAQLAGSQYLEVAAEL